MSEKIHVLAQQLFGKASIDECDLQQTRDLADRYPYFAPAQFLLLEKLKKENSPGYAAQLQKAVLYYHDPLEFEYFISSEKFETEVDLEALDPSAVSGDDHGEVAEGSGQAAPPAAGRMEEPVMDRIETAGAVDATETGEEKMEAAIERVLEQEEQQRNQPLSGDLVFEPYHTVDYFASQGIRLSQEEGAKDKFAKQLKSFTEWLKTMKRLPATEISKEMDSSTESRVQHLAEDSVHQSEVLTEAMAEVWIKQGNREKAIETYNKLGLLNPSKKAYFAALIDNLKRS